MISYPGAEKALREANGDRAAARAAVRAHILAEANLQVLRAARSLKCARDFHAYVSGGCANDGLTCLCECHDGLGGHR